MTRARKILLVGLSCAAAFTILCASADAWQRKYTIKPRYYDVDPYDGFMDPGTWLNPYEIRDNSGRDLGTIRPKYYDMDPYDGFMDPGTWQNPYEIEVDY